MLDKRQGPARGSIRIVRALRAAPNRLIDAGRQAAVTFAEWATKNHPTASRAEADETRLGFEVLWKCSASPSPV
jgi:hypothetical protein